MRILSKSAHYMHLVRNEVTSIGQDQYGVLRQQTIKPQIMLEFTQHGLTGYDIQFGLQHWGRQGNRDPLDPFGSDAWGAHPDDRDGVIQGQVYRGWRPQQQFSVYDTSGLDPEAKEVVEAYFTANPQGQDWIVVTPKALVPPWPTYDTMHAAKIAPTAHELGLAAEAIQYEEATLNRESVLKALHKERVRQVEEQLEDEALKVIVP